MCGRGRCKIGKESLAAATGVPAADFHDMAQFAGAENMSPGSCFPIKSKNEEGDTQLRAMVWGLIPSFSISVASPNHFKMFNARSETVYEKKSFSALIQSRRGVVFMNGYYEWKIEAGIKQPYYVHRSSGELLKMACVFDTYRRRDDLSVLYTFSILTTEANKTISWLHERQPLFIVDKDTEATWCAQDTPRSGVVSVLASRDVPHDITAHPVTRKVSSALYQEDDCCIAIPRQRKANSYFSRADDSNTVKKEISADVAVADTPKRSHSDTPPTANNTIISYFRQSTTPIIKRYTLSRECNIFD